MYMVLLDTSLIFLVGNFSLLYKKDAPKVTQNSLNSKLFYLKDLNLHIPYIFLKQNKTKQTNKKKTLSTNSAAFRMVYSYHIFFLF